MANEHTLEMWLWKSLNRNSVTCLSLDRCNKTTLNSHTDTRKCSVTLKSAKNESNIEWVRSAVFQRQVSDGIEEITKTFGFTFVKIVGANKPNDIII